jgi:hypothetical protein
MEGARLGCLNDKKLQEITMMTVTTTQTHNGSWETMKQAEKAAVEQAVVADEVQVVQAKKDIMDFWVERFLHRPASSWR